MSDVTRVPGEPEKVFASSKNGFCSTSVGMK